MSDNAIPRSLVRTVNQSDDRRAGVINEAMFLSDLPVSTRHHDAPEHDIVLRKSGLHRTRLLLFQIGPNKRVAIPEREHRQRACHLIARLFEKIAKSDASTSRV